MLIPTDSKSIRSSVGAGLVWDSPFGPLRFDYAIPITKESYDIVQEFRFGGGTQVLIADAGIRRPTWPTAQMVA